MGRVCSRWLPGRAARDLLEPVIPKFSPSSSYAHGAHGWDPAHGGSGDRVQLHPGKVSRCARDGDREDPR